MLTWMRRGIPVALLAGGVLAMTAGNAAAAPAPIGDPTGVADTALRLTDLVGHKGLPPLPFASQLELPAMPIGQSQRDLPAGLDNGSLSLSNVELNGQDLAHPGLPGLSAIPGLGADQRSLDPSQLAISGVPQLQQLPKLPGLPTAGLPVSVLPEVSTSRSLPNFSYSGFVPTGGLHSLTKVPDLANPTALTQADGPVELPAVPALPLGGEQRSLPGLNLLSALPIQGLLAGGLPVGRSLPGTDILGTLPVGGLLGGVAAERDLPGLPKLPLNLPGVPVGRELPGLNLLSALPIQGLLAGGLPVGRSLPGTDILGTLPVGGLLAGGLPVGRELPGLNLLSALPIQGLLAGGLPVGRELPGLNLLSALPIQGLLAGGLPVGRSLPGTDILGTLPVGGLLGGVAAERDLPGLPALPKLPLPGLGAERDLPALPGLESLSMVFGLVKATPVAALLANTPLSSVAGRDLPGLGSLPLAGLLGSAAPAMTDSDADTDADFTADSDARDLPGLPALPKLPLPGLGAQQRELPIVDSVLPKLPLAVPAVPGATISNFHGIPALGPSFATTMPANDSARTIVPGVPSTADVLGGVLGHAPRLPISGI